MSVSEESLELLSIRRPSLVVSTMGSPMSTMSTMSTMANLRSSTFQWVVQGYQAGWVRPIWSHQRLKK